jgi:MerR family regulatory protein
VVHPQICSTDVNDVIGKYELSADRRPVHRSGFRDCSWNPKEDAWLRRCAPLSQTLLSSMAALAMLQDAEPCHHRREELFPDMLIFLKTMDFSLDMPKAARLYTCKTYITCISDKRSPWMTWMTAKLYKIKDVALRLDRSILTIKRWEKQGLIPKARKDSRGWRVYMEEEVVLSQISILGVKSGNLVSVIQ